MKCKLCRREAEGSSNLCVFHTKAGEALLEAYKRWNNAYGELSWKEYLRRIKGRAETGQWVKDVVEMEGSE